MTIRKFNEKDYQTVLNIYSQAKLDELRYEKQTFKFLPLAQDKIRLAALMQSDIYVYDTGHHNIDNSSYHNDDKINTEIVAYGAVYQQEIRALFVLPSSRGLGIGKTLLKFLMTKISGDISLYVADSNLPAKQLYQAYNFKVTEVFNTTYNGVLVVANKMVRTKS